MLNYCATLVSMLNYCVMLVSMLNYCATIVSMLNYCATLVSMLNYCATLVSMLNYCATLVSRLHHCWTGSFILIRQRNTNIPVRHPVSVMSEQCFNYKKKSGCSTLYTSYVNKHFYRANRSGSGNFQFADPEAKYVTYQVYHI